MRKVKSRVKISQQETSFFFYFFYFTAPPNHPFFLKSIPCSFFIFSKCEFIPRYKVASKLFFFFFLDIHCTYFFIFINVYFPFNIATANMPTHPINKIHIQTQTDNRKTNILFFNDLSHFSQLRARH